MCFKYSLSVSFEGLLQICALLKYGIYDIGHICPAEAELYTGCCLCTEEKGSPLWPGEVFFLLPTYNKAAVLFHPLWEVVSVGLF